jgi:hypothetical protein
MCSVRPVIFHGGATIDACQGQVAGARAAEVVRRPVLYRAARDLDFLVVLRHQAPNAISPFVNAAFKEHPCLSAAYVQLHQPFQGGNTGSMPVGATNFFRFPPQSNLERLSILPVLAMLR